jgi:hypothetical protein
MPGSIVLRLTYLAAAMSLLHHVDHAIRGNAIRWPSNPASVRTGASSMPRGIYRIGLHLITARPISAMKQRPTCR